MLLVEDDLTASKTIEVMQTHANPRVIIQILARKAPIWWDYTITNLVFWT